MTCYTIVSVDGHVKPKEKKSEVAVLNILIIFLEPINPFSKRQKDKKEKKKKWQRESWDQEEERRKQKEEEEEEEEGVVQV